MTDTQPAWPRWARRLRKAGLGPWLAFWLEALEPLAPLLAQLARGGCGLFPSRGLAELADWLEDDTRRARWRAFWWSEL